MRPEEGPRVVVYGFGCLVATVAVGVVIGVLVWQAFRG